MNLRTFVTWYDGQPITCYSALIYDPRLRNALLRTPVLLSEGEVWADKEGGQVIWQVAGLPSSTDADSIRVHIITLSQEIDGDGQILG